MVHSIRYAIIWEFWNPFIRNSIWRRENNINRDIQFTTTAFQNYTINIHRHQHQVIDMLQVRLLYCNKHCIAQSLHCICHCHWSQARRARWPINLPELSEMVRSIRQYELHESEGNGHQPQIIVHPSLMEDIIAPSRISAIRDLFLSISTNAIVQSDQTF